MCKSGVGRSLRRSIERLARVTLMALGTLGIGERINGVNLGNWLVLERWMLRPILAGNQVIVFHDGFRLGRWRGWFVREGMRGVMLDTHVYLVMAEQFPLFRLIPDRWLMGWYRLFVRWNERRIRRAARYTPVIVGEWCVANGLVNRVVDKRTGDGGRSKENAMHSASIRGSIYREVAAMQRKAWNVSAGQIYWSYQLRGNRDFLPTIDPQSDTSRLDPWDFTHVWHAGWMV